MGKEVLITLWLIFLVSFLFASPQEDWDFAESLFSRGMYDLALKEYLSYEKKYPEDKEILSLLKFRKGECYLQLKNLREAEKSFKEVVSLKDKKEKEALYRLSQIYIEEGRYKEAENILFGLKKVDTPERLREGILSLLAELMIRERKGENAQVFIKELKAEFPKSLLLPYAWFNLATFYWEKGEKELTDKFLLYALSSSPPSLLKKEILYSLGRVNLELAQYKEARKYFSELLQEFPLSKQIDNSMLGIGMSYYHENKWEEAKKWFSALEKKSVEDKNIKESLWLWMGKLYFQLKKWKKSAYYLSLLSSTSPLYNESQYFLAQIKREEGKPEEARQILKEIVAMKGRYAPSSLLLLSEMYKEEGDFESALRCLEDINSFRNSPYYPELLYEKGILLEKISRYKDSSELFTHFLRLFPSHRYYISALFHRGLGLYYSGNYSSAERDFQGLKKRDVSGNWSEGADYYLIQIALKTGNLELFFKRVDEFLKSFPKSSWKEEVVYQAGIVAKRNDDLSTALKYFLLYIDEFPNGKYSAKVHYLLSYIYFLRKEKNKSAHGFLTILNKFPEYPLDKNTLLWVAEYFLKSKNYSDALFVYQRIEEKFNDRDTRAAVEVGKGEIEILSGNLVEGIKKLEEFLDKFPDSRLKGKACFLLGEAYSMRRDGEKSVEYWEKATEDGEYAPYALYSLGKHFFSTGSYAQAYRYYLKLAYLYQGFPLIPEALYKAGISLRRLGKDEEAEKVFQELFTRFPKSKEAKKLREKNWRR